MEERRNFLTPLLLIVSLCLLGLSGWLFYQNQQLKSMLAIYQTQPSPTPISTPDLTTDWKTYISEKYGFRLKYPSAWRAEDISPTNTEAVVEFNFKDIALFVVKILNNYNSKTNKPYASLDEYLGARKELAKDAELNSLPAKYISLAGDGGHTISFKEIISFTNNKNKIIDLYYNWPYYDKLESDMTFDQILSTFKFTSNGGEGQFCGGIAGILCPEGYYCKYEGSYPDASGVCIKSSSSP